MKHDTTPREINITISSKQIGRFWQLVEKSAGCWEWQGGRFTNGYGLITFHRKHYKAHRIAWMLTNGILPANMFVCHHCDNPSCVRPDHLFLGTPKDNHDDMKSKGRSPVGDRNGRRTKPGSVINYAKGAGHPNSKLTEQEALEIRRRFIRSSPYRTNATILSREFGVSPTTVANIATGVSWSHLASQDSSEESMASAK